MRESPVALTYAPEQGFKYIGGDSSLDLVNTVDWLEEGLVDDRLSDYARVVQWAEGAGLVSAREADELRRIAVARPREAEAAREAARRLRWVLQRVFAAVARGAEPGSALDEFNGMLRDALGHLALAPAGAQQGERGGIRWAWGGMGEALDSLLWPVIWSAAGLLVSADAQRIRVCAGRACGWMFADRSRNGLRRWCEMSVCGTREKSRRRRVRSRLDGVRAGAAKEIGTAPLASPCESRD